jgi:hypothetical protein
MAIRCVLIVSLALSAAAPLAAAAGPTAAAGDLWIQSGQSNACGRGLPPGPPADPAVEAFDPKTGQCIAALDPLPGMGTAGVGSWRAAASEYAGLTKRRVRLAGSARGGSKIELWNAADGPVWKTLSGVLDRAGRNAGVFLWYQGEANCSQGHDRYLADFQNLTARVRLGCGNPGMTVVVVQLGGFNAHRGRESEGSTPQRLRKGSAHDVMRMREIQRRCVLADPAAILVPAMGRETQDNWHLSTAGRIELGREIGRALAARLHGVATGPTPKPKPGAGTAP